MIARALQVPPQKRSPSVLIPRIVYSCKLGLAPTPDQPTKSRNLLDLVFGITALEAKWREKSHVYGFEATT